MIQTDAQGPLVVYGAGGLADEVAWLALSLGWDVQGFAVTDASHLPIRRPDQLWGLEPDLLNSPQRMAVAVAVGQPIHRQAAWNRLQAAPQLVFPTLVHPSVILDQDTCQVGPGVLLAAQVVLTTHVSIGAGTLVNLGCTIGHDTRIGIGCVLNPGARISGEVTIGDGVLVGSGAVVLQGLRLGAGSTLGAGAVLTRDLPPGETWAGVPARPLR